MSENSTMGPQARTIAVDAEHFGVRFMVPVMTIGLTLLVHVIGMFVLDAVLTEGANPACVMLPVDAVVLIALGFGSERVLKRLFPSRRKCLLSDDALEMRDARRQPPVVTTIEWDGTVNVLAWRFSVSAAMGLVRAQHSPPRRMVDLPERCRGNDLGEGSSARRVGLLVWLYQHVREVGSSAG